MSTTGSGLGRALSPQTAMYRFWVPGSGAHRGVEISNRFSQNGVPSWATYADLPSRQRKHLLWAELRSLRGSALGFSRFRQTVLFENGDVARWDVDHGDQLAWSFSFRGEERKGTLPVSPRDDLFYSVHALAFDVQLGWLFLAAGKQTCAIPTLSIPVLPEDVGPQHAPIELGYFHVRKDEPPLEVRNLAKEYLEGQPPGHFFWLRLHSAEDDARRNNLATAVWQLYRHHGDLLELLFCYVPQYPSCYSLVTTLRQ